MTPTQIKEAELTHTLDNLNTQIQMLITIDYLCNACGVNRIHVIHWLALKTDQIPDKLSCPKHPKRNMHRINQNLLPKKLKTY